MNTDNTNYLLYNFSFFRLGEPITSPFRAFGFECGDGWFDIIKDLCERLDALNLSEEFEVNQVKEKFGGLRFYVSGVEESKSEEVHSLIYEAEEKSFSVCENCGASGKTASKRDWLKTLCETCYSKW